MNSPIPSALQPLSAAVMWRDWTDNARAFEKPVEETLPISRLSETNVDVIHAATDETNRREII